MTTVGEYQVTGVGGSGSGGGGLNEDELADKQAESEDVAIGGGQEMNQQQQATPDVCRDYLNNVCFRGSRCKYYHPAGMTQKSEIAGGESKVMFCKDYLNQVCYRGSCKYVHCSREEKEMYEQTGRVTETLARAIVAATGQDVIDGRPLCKEFLSNHCSRGARCRFWHINPKQEREMRMMGPEPNVGDQRLHASGQQSALGYRATFDTIRDFKRRAPDDETMGHGAAGSPAYHRARYDTTTPNSAAVNSSAMCEEIVSLRNRLDMMKQSLVDLMSQNDRLLTENARLRAKLTAANITDTNILPINSMITNTPPVTAATLAANPNDRWPVLH